MITLISLLASRPKLLNAENIELLSILVRRDNGKFLLHFACTASNDHPAIVNRLATLRLLLRVGANPDAPDDDGERPHHWLGRNNPTDEAAARLLLDAGAFLGRLNNEGSTAVDLWKKRNTLDEDVDATDMPIWLLDYDQVPKLKIQCGRAVRSHEVNYSRLPQSLRNFIEMRPEGNEESSLGAA